MTVKGMTRDEVLTKAHGLWTRADIIWDRIRMHQEEIESLIPKAKWLDYSAAKLYNTTLFSTPQ